MHRLNLIIATSAVVALTSHTVVAYADADADAGGDHASSATVLNDIGQALAVHPEAQAEAIADANPVVMPHQGAGTATLATVNGTLTMRVPAQGAEVSHAKTGTTVFDGNASAVSVAIQDTTQGPRALLDIGSPNAPERFSFKMGGDVATLKATEDGGVQALNAHGDVLATAPAPWATDADGAEVPTHYEISGTTLIQVVSHHAAAYKYGIVADPWWNPFTWNWGKIWSKTKSAVASALKKCGKGALVGVFGLGVGTGTTNVLITKYSSTVAMMKVGGVYGYIGAAVAGCIMTNL